MSGTRCGVNSPCCPDGKWPKKNEKIYDNKTAIKREKGEMGFPFRLTYCTSNIFKALASAPTSSFILKSNISLLDDVGLSMM